ncbi:PrgI family protein [Mesobacillus zeae]|uniref:PrgI family protein n=1 Tax=Mesobacillus zeae TaxID=1917180 RepID=UPI00300A4EC8
MSKPKQLQAGLQDLAPNPHLNNKKTAPLNCLLEGRNCKKKVLLMRKETVPIDMSSEQKTILGFISKRQLIYIIAGGAVLYALIPIVFGLFPSYIVGAIACVIVSMPILIFVFVFGFIQKTKLHLHFDHYFLIKLGYKNQIGIWRKGRNPKDWMVNQ